MLVRQNVFIITHHFVCLILSHHVLHPYKARRFKLEDCLLFDVLP